MVQYIEHIFQQFVNVMFVTVLIYHIFKALDIVVIVSAAG